MPQMNPIWWFTLFIFFILHLLLTNPINYFFISPNLSSSSKKFSVNKIVWKW